jgi:hypothetical protein
MDSLPKRLETAAAVYTMVSSFRRFIFSWDTLKIAKWSLGKYIVLAACMLHVIWAVLLTFDVRAGNATPVAIFFRFGLNRWGVIALLTAVSVGGFVFLSLRMRHIWNVKALSFLLVPQQFVMLCSAIAGLEAILKQQYADGVFKSWSHIAADQSAIIVMAILYTVACLETRTIPVRDANGKLDANE